MADDKHDKTEEASPQRLEQKRKKGEIPLGKDATSVASLLGGALGLFAFSGPLSDSLYALVHASADGMLHPSDSILQDMLPMWLEPIGLGILIIVIAAGMHLAVSLAMTQGGFWMERLSPDPSRLFQPDRLTRLFKVDFFTDLAMSLVKVLAVGGALYVALYDEFMTLPNLVDRAPAGLLAAMFRPLGKGSAVVLVIMIALAALDFALQRHRFLEKAKMKKEEVKREHKEEDGDPQIKSARRRRHREMAQGRVEKDVPLADALVVNPTHISIAIRYRKDESAAPKVICKGQGERAKKMREVARESGVPIVKDIPLARLLHKQVKVGQQVPAETFAATAAVLAFVYRTTGKAPGTGR